MTSQPLNHRSARAWKGNHCTHFVRSTSECALQHGSCVNDEVDVWIPTRTGFSGESETVDFVKFPYNDCCHQVSHALPKKTQPTMTETKNQEKYNMCITRSILWTCYENCSNYTRYRPFECMNAERKCQFRSTEYAFSWLDPRNPRIYSTTGADILTSQQH